ncbi:PilW family protein [Kosmotoga sp. DU53]|jgi:prepilin-type N-terminal cleavage/methylation domain-containing protein|nr:type II secretion system protein [Kosmotoga sp. DU53]
MFMKRGFSLIEMVLTLLVISLVLVSIFQSFTSTNSLLNKSYTKLTAVTDLKQGTLALWFFRDSDQAGEYTTSTNFSRDDSIFDELREEGVSEDIVERFENSIEFWVLETEEASEIYIAVKLLKDWR